MGVAVLVLGIMYLKGASIGTALAICSIILGSCLLLKDIATIAKKIAEGEI